MGDRNRWIADIDAHPGEAPDLARNVLDWLIATEVVAAAETECVLGEATTGHAPGPAYKKIVTRSTGGFPDVWPNGLEVGVGREAYYGPVGADERVTCSRCGAWLPFATVLPSIEEWVDGGSGSLVCAACGGRTGLNGWAWPVPCAFAELGFRFWNWPPLTRALTDDVTRRLDHRVIIGNSGHDRRI